MKEYEKLIGFVILLAAICWLAWMTSGEQTFVMVDGKPVSISSGSGMRDVLVGMIGVLGMAGQALFRTNEMAAAMNELLARTVEKLGNSAPAAQTDPTIPQTVVIQQPADQPVPVETAEERPA